MKLRITSSTDGWDAPPRDFNLPDPDQNFAECIQRAGAHIFNYLNEVIGDTSPGKLTDEAIETMLSFPTKRTPWFHHSPADMGSVGYWIVTEVIA